MPVDYNPRLLEIDLKRGQGFDVIGDIHGCADEMFRLVAKAGYSISRKPKGRSFEISHPEGRKLFLVGDIVDRGPNSLDALRFMRSLMKSKMGSATIGNHDYKCLRALNGRPVKVANGLEGTLRELEATDPDEREKLRKALERMPTQILVRRPRTKDTLIVHGAAPEHHQRLAQKASFERAIYGYPNGVDEHGGIIRKDWAADYSGDRTVVHGHVITPEIYEKNDVFNIDTGCAFGGKLTMIRVYEREFIDEPASKIHHFKPGFLRKSLAEQE